MTAAPRIDRYEWAGGCEAMLRFGPDEGPVVVVAPPLFEEANRTRAFVCSILRNLADRGVGGALPDLPGQGESLVATEDATLPDWRAAFAAAVAHAAADRPAHIAAVRGGSLLTRDARARSRWLLAPVDGAALVRDLLRTAMVAHGTTRADFPIDEPGPPQLLAGNAIARATLRDLRDAVPDRTTPTRLLRLDGDPAAADRHVAGAPLWRRAEPGDDHPLARLLADDIADWIVACER